MNWAQGIKAASIIVGLSTAISVAVVGLFLTIGGWAFIPLVALLFGAIVIVEAAQ